MNGSAIVAVAAWAAFAGWIVASIIRNDRDDARQRLAAHLARVREYEQHHPRLPDRFTVETSSGTRTFTNKRAHSVLAGGRNDHQGEADDRYAF